MIAGYFSSVNWIANIKKTRGENTELEDCVGGKEYAFVFLTWEKSISHSLSYFLKPIFCC